MAVRTVTVDLKLNATSYLAIARSVVGANRGIEDSLEDVSRAAAAAGTASAAAGRDFAQMGARARLAERRVRELREEVDRLIAAQAALAAGGAIPNIGGSGGRMGGGLLRSISAGFGALPPQAQAAIGVAVLGAIGASIGGIILTALGAGGLAAGIASSVMNDNEVQAAFSRFGRFVKGEFKTYGEAFDVPLIEAANRFSDRFATISPKIRGVLAEMSVAVGPVADGLFGMLERAGPGIAAALRASIPILKAFGAELPEIGDAAGDMFRTIAGGAEGAQDGLIGLLRMLEALMRAVGGITRAGSEIMGFWFDLPAPLRMMMSGGPVGGLIFENIHDGGKSKQFIDLGKGIEEVGYKADETTSSINRLRESLMQLTNGFNDQFAAAMQFEEAMDALSASVKENGRSMDIGTAAGRANSAALMDVFRAARATYEANIASGMSAQEAARKYNEQIEAARRAAIAAGMAADQVNRLAAAQRNLPTGEKVLTYKVITKFITEGSPNYRRTPGVQVAQRDGGIVYARDGMMAFGRTSGIASGGRPLIGFAEAGTGGEAFIARNAPASRSLAIANTAAGWHGGQVVPRGFAPRVVVVVPPAPTNANRAVVDAVTSQIRENVRIQSRGDVVRHFGRASRV